MGGQVSGQHQDQVKADPGETEMMLEIPLGRLSARKSVYTASQTATSR
jgi:hypothetical protein